MAKAEIILGEGGSGGGYNYKEDVHVGANTSPSFSATVGKKYIVIFISGWNSDGYGADHATIDSYTGLSNLNAEISPTWYKPVSGQNIVYEFSMYSFTATSSTVTITLLRQGTANTARECIVFEQA